MEGDSVNPDLEKHVTPAAKAVEPGCPICLESFEDKAFVDVCFHTFCFACILQWADVVSSCPMCKVPFKSIIHNVRGVDSYDQHEIRAKPVLASQEVSLTEARRFWYRTTRLTSTRKGHKDSSSSKRSVSHKRDIAAQKRRQAIYSANLWVKPPAAAAEQGVKKIRVANAQFYKSNPATTHRLMPWLTREFKVILGEENTSFMVALVNSMLSKRDITSPEFAENLRPFLFEQTEHFVHEFVSFAQSPYDMIAYDDNAEYDVPSDGTSLPELLPVDDEPGPSGISSTQQKLLDNLDDDKFGSPVMKQCRGEDDTSSGSHDEDTDDREKKKKDERSRSRSHSRVHDRDHSRDNGDKAHPDDCSRSRKMHADYYGNRDRYDNRGRYGDRSSRRHSHHHRHHHGYSSDSSTERHSYKRRRRSSSRERHHSDRHRSSRKDKKSKSSKSDRRRSRSAERKKKRRHHHSSSSSSPTRRHSDNKKSVEVTAYDDDILKQAPDDILQDQLVNIETQINMDKKMLLKNMLRKERLELLHESLEKEQIVDELTSSDDSKLKEELQQLDEAIKTGKNALVKVMKRIVSTESERNNSEQ